MSTAYGKLYVVGTPIGNMGDITLRALEILKSVDVILCEDTRTTKNLLHHYQINARTISYHSHSKLSRIKEIKEMLAEGKNLALVSDAGTPCISDPGVMLVAELKQEFEIIAIPGPSALIAALSIAGVPTHEFIFKGFVPHKKGRGKFFKEVLESTTTVIFYESVHRILKTLDSLGTQKIILCRELTKLYEEVIRGSAQEVSEYLQNNEKVKGEFVVIVEGKK